MWSLWCKKTTQNPTSWFIWALLAVLSFVASLLLGQTNWLALAYVVGGGLIVVLSLIGKRGRSAVVGEKGVFVGFACAVLCFAGVLWILYPQYAVYWMCAASNIAGIPLLMHAWRHPDQQIVESWILFAMGAVFNPLGVAFAAGAGGAIGELTGYLTGFSGQAIVENTKIYNRLLPWIKKYGAWVILVLSAFPNPFFDMAGIAAGIARIPLWQFLLACWVGQTIKMALFAYAGAYSIDWIAGLYK